MPWFKVITDQGKILTDESQVIGLLVQLSSTHYWAYTCCLSTKWSTWILILANGNLSWMRLRT